MLGMYGLGTQELIIAGIVLVVLVFAPFLFAFARAGFRHPLLTAIPVSIAVFLVVALAAGFTGVNALAILAIIAIAAIVYGFSQSVIRTSDNESEATPRKASSAAHEASTSYEVQPTGLSKAVSEQVAEKTAVETPFSSSGPSAPRPLMWQAGRVFARSKDVCTERPEFLLIPAVIATAGILVLIAVMSGTYHTERTSPKNDRLAEQIEAGKPPIGVSPETFEQFKNAAKERFEQLPGVTEHQRTFEQLIVDWVDDHQGQPLPEQHVMSGWIQEMRAELRSELVASPEFQTVLDRINHLKVPEGLESAEIQRELERLTQQWALRRMDADQLLVEFERKYQRWLQDSQEVNAPAAAQETQTADASDEAQTSHAPTRTISDEGFRFAAYEGNIETVRQALEAGMDVNSSNSDTKLTPLHMAAYNGHTSVVKLLIENDAAIDARDREGKTALTHACTGPFQETVALLLEAGADINAREATEGFTPLMMAAGLGQMEVVKVLLRNDADTSLRDTDGDRAIDHARTSGHLEIVKLIE